MYYVEKWTSSDWFDDNEKYLEAKDLWPTNIYPPKVYQGAQWSRWGSAPLFLKGVTEQKCEESVNAPHSGAEKRGEGDGISCLVWFPTECQKAKDRAT